MPSVSQTPVDRLIRELSETGREASADELDTILRRLAAASFSRRELRTPSYLQELAGERADSLTIHWAKHVRLEQQWAENVSTGEYLRHLQAAVIHPEAHLVVYNPPRGPVAAVLAPNTIPAERLGESALSHLWVVYGANFGRLLAGYQVSGLEYVTIMGEATWLK